MIASQPLDERDLAALQALLDDVPKPLEPLDLGAIDGYLCGVLVQPRVVAEGAWWPRIVDIDARPLPARVDVSPLKALVRRRHGELAEAIAARRWFDPWVFAQEAESEDDDEDAVSAAVQPWAFGFSVALEAFATLLERDDDEVTAPLALLYRHLGVDHLEDADALQAEIEALPPPPSLEVAVEELVRATLLLADAAGVPKR